MTILGRIDIQYPDGRSETHRLDDRVVTIGSAADNTIQIRNAGLAARHFRFSLADDDVFLTHLGAGHVTTIDGEPAPVDQPRPIPEVAQIRAGDLNMVFYRSSKEQTVAMHAISEATQPAAVGFRADLEQGELKVWPFSSASTVLSVTNTTDEEASFKLETAGLPAEWMTPERLSFEVAANDTMDLLIHIKPPRTKHFAPGEYPLTISIRHLHRSEDASQLILLVQLGGVSGLSVALDRARLRAHEPFNLRLLNLGNEDLPLGFRSHGTDGRFAIKLAQDDILLDAGERAVISGIAELRRRPLLGKPSQRSFALLAEAYEPNNYTVALPANITVTPLLQLPALIAAALVIAIVILALGALLYQPPQPKIVSFNLGVSLVAQGTPVEVNWSAADSRRYVVEVDRAPIVELPADVTGFTLDTSRYVDPIDIALIALNGDASDIRSARLEVYEPVNISLFETDKTALVRGIPSDLTIRWRVEGAVALDIAMPAGFESLRETIEGGEGAMVIEGAASDDFQIILTAEDEIGGTTTRAIAIAIEAPECTPIQDTLLYTGPASRFERANYAVQNVPVLANGINAAADWLQVELASGDLGWGFLANFRCHGFDPKNLNVISDIPQLPTLALSPTPTIAPTQTATATAIATSASTRESTATPSTSGAQS